MKRTAFSFFLPALLSLEHWKFCPLCLQYLIGFTLDFDKHYRFGCMSCCYPGRWTSSTVLNYLELLTTHLVFWYIHLTTLNRLKNQKYHLSMTLPNMYCGNKLFRVLLIEHIFTSRSCTWWDIVFWEYIWFQEVLPSAILLLHWQIIDK